LAIITIIPPFIPSKINVKAPHFLPINLATLVAPILPEPFFLMSIFPTIFPIAKPNGIEQIR